jgi:diguanylate cyclase (GGDEF)-like protein
VVPETARSEAERSLDRQTFYLSAISQIGRTLARVATLEQLLFEIADYFTEIAVVRWTCVYLRDPRTDRYLLRQNKLVVPQEGWAPPVSVLDSSIVELWKGDHPRPVDGVEFGPGAGPCYFLALLNEGTPMGFLLFGEKLTGEEIQAQEREFLNTLASQAALAIRHVLLLDETARIAENLKGLNDVAQLLTRSDKDFTSSVRAMWGKLQPFLGLEEGLLVPIAPGVEKAQLGITPLGDAEWERVLRWCKLVLTDSERGAQLQRGEVILLEGNEIESSFPVEFRPPDVGGQVLALLPLFYDQELEAVLVLRAPTDAERFRNHRQMLPSLSPMLSSAFQKARDHLKLERLATTDGLTGLYNHRFFHDKLQEEYLRAYRTKDRVGLLLLDVDHFKSINDAFGHVFGDQVLARMADVLKTQVRQIDIAARYGGEEFAVILPRAGAQEAAAVGDRVRYAVEQTLPIRLERKVARLTVSVGVGAYPESASTKEKLIEAADGALYLAKHAGRNRVVVAAPADA